MKTKHCLCLTLLAAVPFAFAQTDAPPLSRVPAPPAVLPAPAPLPAPATTTGNPDSALPEPIPDLPAPSESRATEPAGPSNQRERPFRPTEKLRDEERPRTPRVEERRETLRVERPGGGGKLQSQPLQSGGGYGGGDAFGSTGGGGYGGGGAAGGDSQQRPAGGGSSGVGGGGVAGPGPQAAPPDMRPGPPGSHGNYPGGVLPGRDFAREGFPAEGFAPDHRFYPREMLHQPESGADRGPKPVRLQKVYRSMEEFPTAPAVSRADQIIREAKLRAVQHHFEMALGEAMDLEKALLDAPAERREMMEAKFKALQGFTAGLESQIRSLTGGPESFNRPVPNPNHISVPSEQPGFKDHLPLPPSELQRK